MAEYKLTLRQTTGGKVVGYRETFYKSRNIPKEGERFTTLTQPPDVKETIIRVEKVKRK